LTSQQIPLQLQPAHHKLLDNFVAGPNRAVLDSLHEFLDQPAGAILLSGPEGSGKSHLLSAVFHQALEQGLNSIYLSLKQMPAAGVEVLSDLDQLDLVCVDDLQAVVGLPQWEQALFHLFNRVREAGGGVLMASRFSARQLAVELPDLKSRLGWGLQLRLKPMDDSDKLKVLRQTARREGAELPEDVARYLLRHGPRGMKALLDHLDQLQQAAFAGKRPLTVPLARSILQGG